MRWARSFFFSSLIHFGLLRNTRSRLIINENACVCRARVGVGALIALWKHTDAQPMRETLYIACIARRLGEREREQRAWKYPGATATLRWPAKVSIFLGSSWLYAHRRGQAGQPRARRARPPRRGREGRGRRSLKPFSLLLSFWQGRRRRRRAGGGGGEEGTPGRQPGDEPVYQPPLVARIGWAGERLGTERHSGDMISREHN